MTVLIDLKDHELAARGCGNCSGSHSDNKIRAKVEDDVTADGDTGEQGHDA
jgi:hypothetical protein